MDADGVPLGPGRPGTIRWNTLAEAVALISVLLPVVGAVTRIVSMAPNPAIPMQAILSVSLAHLALVGFGVVVAPLVSALLAWFGLNAMAPIAAGLAEASAAIDAAERSLLAAREAEGRASPDEAVEALTAQAEHDIDRAQETINGVEGRLSPWFVWATRLVPRRLLVVLGTDRAWPIEAGPPGLLVVLIAVFQPFPGYLLATAASIGLFLWLSRGSSRGRRVSFAEIVVPMVLALAVSAVAYGLVPYRGQVVYVTVSPSVEQPSGWYILLSDFADPTYLLACSGRLVVAAPLSSVESIVYTKASPAFDWSLLHVLQTRTWPPVGLVAACPSGASPPP